MAWSPPGVDPVEFSALVPGLPAWLDGPVRDWVEVTAQDSRGVIDRDLLEKFDLASHNPTPIADRAWRSSFDSVWRDLDLRMKLALVDFLVYENRVSMWGSRNAVLEDLLVTGGSEWRIGTRNDAPGLEKRVPQGVADAAEAVMRTAGTAGALLSEAWHAAFGRDPDPEEAYEKAIKAVEEAGAEKVAPKNDRTTLGTMARDMESQNDWALPLGDDEKHPAKNVAYMMVRALWSGQESRHGGNGYRKPTSDEAEAAVLLAVPLVQWFTSGVLQRRP